MPDYELHCYVRLAPALGASGSAVRDRRDGWGWLVALRGARSHTPRAAVGLGMAACSRPEGCAPSAPHLHTYQSPRPRCAFGPPSSLLCIKIRIQSLATVAASERPFRRSSTAGGADIPAIGLDTLESHRRLRGRQVALGRWEPGSKALRVTQVWRADGFDRL